MLTKKPHHSTERNLLFEILMDCLHVFEGKARLEDPVHFERFLVDEATPK